MTFGCDLEGAVEMHVLSTVRGYVRVKVEWYDVEVEVNGDW